MLHIKIKLQKSKYYFISSDVKPILSFFNYVPFQCWKSLLCFLLGLVVSRELKGFELVWKDVNSLSEVFVDAFHRLHRKQWSCWFIFHNFKLLIFGQFETIPLMKSFFIFDYIALVFVDFFLLFTIHLWECFLTAAQIFLPKITNDLERLI